MIALTTIFSKMRTLFSSKKNDTPIFFTRDFLKDRNFEIGRYTYGSPNVLSWGENESLRIGNFCSIADGVTIFLGGNHRTDWVTTYPFNVVNPNWSPDFPNAASVKGHPETKGNVVIGSDVWIGKGATILSGIVIGDGAVVAAQSVVTKNVNPYEIVGGNPAKHIRYRFPKNVIDGLLQLQWWNWDAETINSKIHELCQENVEDFLRNNLPGFTGEKNSDG